METILKLGNKMKVVDNDFLLEIECNTLSELNLLVKEIKEKAKHNPNMIVSQGRLYLSTYDYKLMSPIFLKYDCYVRKVNN